MPTQLNITVSVNAGGSIGGGNVSAQTVTVLIPAGLQTLDSNASGGQGQVSQQTGFSSVDIQTRNIFRAGGFLATNGVWYAVEQIQGIGWQ
jgi:hypothetical protein